MEIALFWLIAAVVVGVAAGARGRTGFGWFILAVIISPLLAFLLVIVLPNLRLEAKIQAAVEAPYRSQQVDDVAFA